ncbi:hypothetical protein BH10PSE12_BH10PSE12_28890 [soil metagenome]
MTKSCGVRAITSLQTLSERTLSLRISLVARLQRKRFDVRARAMGMTLAQWRAIHAISEAEGATQRSIAETMDVSDVTAGRLVDRLVEKGWIERRIDKDDRRVKRLFLTSAAAPLLEELILLGEDEQRNQLAGVTSAELAVMSDVLNRMIANLEETDMIGGIADCEPADID